jgi:hypothetical protein
VDDSETTKLQTGSSVNIEFGKQVALFGKHPGFRVADHNDKGGYMLIDAQNKFAVLGPRYGCDPRTCRRDPSTGKE